MIESTGGKLVRVYVHGDEVAMDWSDPAGSDGDMLLSVTATRDLAYWLLEAANVAEFGEVPVGEVWIPKQ